MPYCSVACCANTIKETIALKEKEPGTDAYVLYIDIRTAADGVFLAGSAERPMDIPAAVAGARSTALAVHQYLSGRSA